MERLARVLRVCALCVACGVPVVVPAQDGKAAPQAGVGFRSVDLAFAAVKSRPGAKLATSDGWSIVTEQGGSVVWSFTPAGHPAHPAVVRRTLDVGDDGEPRIDLAMLCEGDKPACDKLLKDFRAINERSLRPLRERIKGANDRKQ